MRARLIIPHIASNIVFGCSFSASSCCSDHPHASSPTDIFNSPFYLPHLEDTISSVRALHMEQSLLLSPFRSGLRARRESHGPKKCCRALGS